MILHVSIVKSKILQNTNMPFNFVLIYVKFYQHFCWLKFVYKQFVPGNGLQLPLPLSIINLKSYVS